MIECHESAGSQAAGDAYLRQLITAGSTSNVCSLWHKAALSSEGSHSSSAGLVRAGGRRAMPPQLGAKENPPGFRPVEQVAEHKRSICDLIGWAA